MAQTRQTSSQDPELQTFDSAKSYIVKGVTLNRFAAIIRRNRPRVLTGGGIKIAQETQDGEFLAIDADELTLNVCINGVGTQKTFYLKRTASS